MTLCGGERNIRKGSDLTGKTFGRWHVIEEAAKKSGSRMWLCQCECGTVKEIKDHYLRYGESKSCGCYKRDKAQSSYEDLTGQKFGRLTAIERILIDGDYRWKCQCDCGKVACVSAKLLKNGHTKSCGCYKISVAKQQKGKQRPDSVIDMTGRRFGRLVVLERSTTKKTSCIDWNCICDCGNIVAVNGNSLRSGKTKSCGCLQREASAQNGRNSRKDLTGQTFGSLLVIGDSGKRNGKNIVWHCKCSCGRASDVPGGSLQSGTTTSCGHCGISSIGERKIMDILGQNMIPYKHDTSILNCRYPDSNGLARFDFFVDDRYVIEFDGIQHFNTQRGSWGNPEYMYVQQKHDMFKNTWCAEHNIPLIRIPYNMVDEITIDELIPETATHLIGGWVAGWAYLLDE